MVLRTRDSLGAKSTFFGSFFGGAEMANVELVTDMGRSVRLPTVPGVHLGAVAIFSF